MKYYWRLFSRIVSISTANMLIYRTNMLFFLIFETLFLIANLTGLKMGISFAGGSLNGWSTDEVLFIAMLHEVGHQIFTTFFLGGLFQIGWFTWTGRMDYVLLKPLHPLVSQHAATEFIISNTPNIVIDVGLLAMFTWRLLANGTTVTLGGCLGLLLFFVTGLAVRYGTALLLVSPAFFAEKLAEGEEAYWAMQSLSKYPSGVFPRLMQNFFTFVIPIVTVAAVPADIFFGHSSLSSVFMYLVIIFVFCAASLQVFKYSLRRYQSVNTGA